MKRIFLLLFVASGSYSYAQTPAMAIRRDSIPSVFPPDLMPNARPNSSFYRSPMDAKNSIRATLDNMPVKVPDSSTNYTMLRSSQTYLKFGVPPMPLIVPKKD